MPASRCLPKRTRRHRGRGSTDLPGLQRPELPPAGDHRSDGATRRRPGRHVDRTGSADLRSHRVNRCRGWTTAARRGAWWAEPRGHPSSRPVGRPDTQRHAVRAPGSVIEGLRSRQERRPGPPPRSSRSAGYCRRHPLLLLGAGRGGDPGQGGGSGGRLGCAVSTARVRGRAHHRRRSVLPEPLGTVRGAASRPHRLSGRISRG